MLGCETEDQVGSRVSLSEKEKMSLGGKKRKFEECDRQLRKEQW